MLRRLLAWTCGALGVTLLWQGTRNLGSDVINISSWDTGGIMDYVWKKEAVEMNNERGEEEEEAEKDFIKMPELSLIHI